jgi:hypothetical protein
MNHDFDAVVYQMIGSNSITKDKLEALIEFLPENTPLVPYAATSNQEDGTAVFGFMNQEVAKSKITDTNVDAFNATLVKEAETPLPPNTLKGIHIFGIKIAIKG